VHHAPFDLYVALQIELVRRGGVVHPSDWNYRGRAVSRQAPAPTKKSHSLHRNEIEVKISFKLEDAAEKWRTPLTPPPVS
jgi:hypothetical protein